MYRTWEALGFANEWVGVAKVRRQGTRRRADMGTLPTDLRRCQTTRNVPRLNKLRETNMKKVSKNKIKAYTWCFDMKYKILE